MRRETSLEDDESSEVIVSAKKVKKINHRKTDSALHSDAEQDLLLIQKELENFKNLAGMMRDKSFINDELEDGQDRNGCLEDPNVQQSSPSHRAYELDVTEGIEQLNITEKQDDFEQ